MALIIDKEGKYTKEEWINNFTIVAAMLDELSYKINNDQLATDDGIATLNNVGKVIQTALNADKLNGLTLAQIKGLEATILDNDADLFQLDTSGNYFVQDAGDLYNPPAGTEGGTEAWITCTVSGLSRMLEFRSSRGTWRSFKRAIDETYTAWIAN